MTISHNILKAAGIVFIAMVAALSFNANLAVDDFSYYYTAQYEGFFEGVIKKYKLWATRYLSVSLNLLVLKLYLKSSLFLGLYFISVFGLLFLTANSIVKKGIELGIKIQNRIVSVILVSLGLFFASFSISENWFWLCASPTYTVSILLFINGILLLHNSTLKKQLLAACCFAFIGGSTGPLALMSVFLIIGLVTLKRKKFNWKNVLIPVLFLLVAFIVLYLGPGNKMRERNFESIGIIEAFTSNFHYLYLALRYALPWYFVFLIPIAFLISTTSSLPEKWKSKLTLKVVALISFSFLGLAFLYVLPITYKINQISAARAMYFIGLLFFIWLTIMSFYYKVNIKILESKQFVNSVSIILLVGLIFLGAYQVKTAVVYDQACSVRMGILNTKQNSYILKPLPPSGFIKSAELGMDPKHFSHYHIKRALNIANETEITISKEVK